MSPKQLNEIVWDVGQLDVVAGNRRTNLLIILLAVLWHNMFCSYMVRLWIPRGGEGAGSNTFSLAIPERKGSCYMG